MKLVLIIVIWAVVIFVWSPILIATYTVARLPSMIWHHLPLFQSLHVTDESYTRGPYNFFSSKNVKDFKLHCQKSPYNTALSINYSDEIIFKKNLSDIEKTI